MYNQIDSDLGPLIIVNSKTDFIFCEFRCGNYIFLSRSV